MKLGEGEGLEMDSKLTDNKDFFVFFAGRNRKKHENAGLKIRSAAEIFTRRNFQISRKPKFLLIMSAGIGDYRLGKKRRIESGKLKKEPVGVNW